MKAAAAADDRVLWLIAAATTIIVFALHYAILIGHFAQGGELLDAGWFAHLIGSGDPWLHGPTTVDAQSYYNVHVSPWLSAVTVAVHALGLDRFTGFAFHQALTFSVFAASLFAIVLRSQSPARRWLFSGSVVLALASDLVLEIAGFPHFEMATLAFCTLGVALAQRGKTLAALVAFGVATLVREDGGLFALLFLVLLRVMRGDGWKEWRAILGSWELRAAAVFGVTAVAMFWIKSAYFLGYPTFSANFSGNNWDHVTPTLVMNRVVYLLTTPRPFFTVAVTLALAFYSWRYLVTPVLISPLITAHVLAVRDDLAKFPLYYVMILLVIWVGHFIVTARRAEEGKLRKSEAIILLAATIAVSMPVFLAVRSIPQMRTIANYEPFTVDALVGLGVDPNELAQKTLEATRGLPGVCVSNGVAALLPDDFSPEQVFRGSRQIDGNCVNTFRFIGPGEEHFALLPGQQIDPIGEILGRVAHERRISAGQ